MGTTADKLALLAGTKADIKAALTEKGRTPGDVFASYGDEVRAIETGGIDVKSIFEIKSNIESIEKEMFKHCFNLISVNFPNATSIGGHAFEQCYNLSTINFPMVASIGAWAFGGCTAHNTSFAFPSATYVGEYAFQSYQGQSIHLPVAESIGDSAFSTCNRITGIVFPAATNIGNNCFSNCTGIEKMDLVAATTIGYDAFLSCAALSTLILRASSVCILSHEKFFNTPISAGTGFIYVPQILIEAYKTAPIWSVYANQFRAIEDYPEITGGAK